MSFRRFRDRWQKSTPLEDALRANRSAPPEKLVDSLVSRIEASRAAAFKPSTARLTLAGGLTAGLVAALTAFGAFSSSHTDSGAQVGATAQLGAPADPVSAQDGTPAVTEVDPQNGGDTPTPATRQANDSRTVDPQAGNTETSDASVASEVANGDALAPSGATEKPGNDAGTSSGQTSSTESSPQPSSDGGADAVSSPGTATAGGDTEEIVQQVIADDVVVFTGGSGPRQPSYGSRPPCGGYVGNRSCSARHQCLPERLYRILQRVEFKVCRKHPDGKQCRTLTTIVERKCGSQV